MTSKKTTHFQKTCNCKTKWIARHRSRWPSSHVRRKRACNESWWFERHYQQLKLLESDGWRFESSQADNIEISPVAQRVEHLISKYVSCIFPHHIYVDRESNLVCLMFQRQPVMVHTWKKGYLSNRMQINGIKTKTHELNSRGNPRSQQRKNSH